MTSGSIGHITSAAAVAASSFDMEVTSPRDYLKGIDPQRLKQLLSKSEDTKMQDEPSIEYVEPADTPDGHSERSDSINNNTKSGVTSQSSPNEEFNGRIQRLGDFVDTDAVSPPSNPFCSGLRMATACTCTIPSNMQGQQGVWSALSRIHQPRVSRSSSTRLQRSCRR